jgi:cation:H+ antiporter
MGVVNAMPEAVTSIAAVRRGALTLATAGVLGGNAFDVLALSFADVAFRGGSIYHATGSDDMLLAPIRQSSA